MGATTLFQPSPLQQSRHFLMSVYAKIIHNGRIIAREDATMPVYTPALVGALGVYETILVKGGKYVALREHIERFYASAAGAALSLAVSPETLKHWCYLVVAANRQDGLVRLLALDLGRAHADIFLYQMSYRGFTQEDYDRGVPVILYHGERALPPVKSFNTLVPGLARKAAAAAGVHDALLVDRDGNITEGSNCNVFAVVDGVLTAAPEGVILEGTVMRRVMMLAQELDIPLARRALPLAELEHWQEAFLTSTRRGVLPINRVGDRPLAAPGPVTRRLLDAYRRWEAAALAGEPAAVDAV
ncbi:MAG: hypothetical protein D6775_10205 [Caldilineae bacterium]|nr:MAG: hypothetical protein D6775_10205 [Caldilineae bacterium]